MSKCVKKNEERATKPVTAVPSSNRKVLSLNFLQEFIVGQPNRVLCQQPYEQATGYIYIYLSKQAK